MSRIFTVGIAGVTERHPTAEERRAVLDLGAVGHSMTAFCRAGGLLLTAALLAVPFVPGQSQAAAPKECIRQECKAPKRRCFKGFKDEFRTARRLCREDEKPGQCRKAKRNEFRRKRRACTDGFIWCGACCRTHQRGCSIVNCGDGVVVEGESCDDANVVDGDGCDSNCTPTACGNGIKTQSEECDDGNRSEGDGCSDECEVEDAALIACIGDCSSIKDGCSSTVKQEYTAAVADCKVEVERAQAVYEMEKAECEREERMNEAQCKRVKRQGLKVCKKAGKRCRQEVRRRFRQCMETVGDAGHLCKSGALVDRKDAKKFFRRCRDEAKLLYRAGRRGCAREYKACKSCCKGDLEPRCSAPRTYCPLNEAGGPDFLTMTVVEWGDLDIGWTGVGHNQGAPAGAKVHACLQDCDLDANPVCTGTGPVGESSINGTALGPPVPVLAGDVATCVTNELTEDITIRRLDLETGEIDMKLRLTSIVYLAVTKEHPCPTCSGKTVGSTGVCEGGSPSQGERCTTDRTTAYLGNTSRDCLPFAEGKVGELEIVLDPVTSGTATLPATNECHGGRCPCLPPNFPPSPVLRMNGCDDPNDCSPENCPSDPMIGGFPPGLDQACCERGSSVIPCFVDAISRTGEAVPAEPVWPDPRFPKIARHGKIASVFCVPRTNTDIINQHYGVAGPGAFVFPVETYVGVVR